MIIKEVHIDSIFQDPTNARMHNIKNIDAIKGSIAKFGQVEPLLVQKGTNVIVGGNGRHSAMKQMGIETVRIIELDINDVQFSGLSVALNRTAELAEWDMDILKDTLKGLKDMDFVIEDIGFEGIDDWSFEADDMVNNTTKTSDGIDATIKIKCPQDYKDSLKQLIEQLISDNGMENVTIN